MPKSVREPIQVYLSSAERETLDRVAAELGVSRSEALRRGILTLGSGHHPGSRASGFNPFVTRASAGPGDPPPSIPVAPLDELLKELSRDREDG